MHIILSPSKTMDFSTSVDFLTEPLYFSEAKELMGLMRSMPNDRLQKLLGTSDKLTEQSLEMIKTFDSAIEKPAVFAYAGDVYTGLDIKSLAKKQLKLAEERILILSGLYGIVRAFDGIKPYRLDIAASLENNQGKTLYPYWKEKITKALIQLTSTSEIILNLASDEYSKAVDWKQIPIQVINVSFLNEKAGKRKVVSYDAKKARGVMAKLILTDNISKVESLIKIDVDGYNFDKNASSNDHLIFVKYQ